METTQSNKFLIPTAIVVAGGLIAGAIYMGGGGSSLAASPSVKPDSIEISPVSAKDHIRGTATPELTIVEYSDTECPFCKVFHNSMLQLMNEYNGKINWVYRQLPIAQLHSKAPKEAEATECVAELGGNVAFWNYLDKIFQTTGSNDSLDPAELPKLAAAVGVDTTSFNTCLSSGRYTEKITKSIEEAAKSGARGTPYSVILDKNGKVKDVINGAEPIEMVKAKIEALLK